MTRRAPDLEELTGPEHAAERAQGKRARERVKACGGCFCCLNRDRGNEGWGIATCGLPRPAQFQRVGCEFQPDYDRIYAGENVE